MPYKQDQLESDYIIEKAWTSSPDWERDEDEDDYDEPTQEIDTFSDADPGL
jgi:hypothetical protein